MSVVELLLEGFEAALLPCSLALLVPALGVSLLARPAAIAAIVSFLVGSTFMVWVRFADLGGNFGQGTAAIGFLAATVLLLVPFTARWDTLAVASGLLAGGAAAEIWIPCVGPQFGTVLNDLPTDGFVGLGKVAVYLVAVLSPILILGTIHFVLPDSILEKAEPIWAIPGAIILGLLAFATALGLHHDLIGYLVEWSMR